MKKVLGVHTTQHHGKFMGLPAMIERSKKQIFSSLRERIHRKVNGWKDKFLSKAGRGVLLKSVAQAIPTYAMSSFRLPQSLCTEIN